MVVCVGGGAELYVNGKQNEGKQINVSFFTIKELISSMGVLFDLGFSLFVLLELFFPLKEKMNTVNISM